MQDDLAYLHERLRDFPGYEDETSRNGSDMRVRAFVGVALTEFQERAASDLDDAARGEVERLIFRSQFSDNAYLKRIGQIAAMKDETMAALADADRKLVEVASRLAGAAPADGAGLLTKIEAQYEERYRVPGV